MPEPLSNTPPEGERTPGVPFAVVRLESYYQQLVAEGVLDEASEVAFFTAKDYDEKFSVLWEKDKARGLQRLDEEPAPTNETKVSHGILSLPLNLHTLYVETIKDAVDAEGAEDALTTRRALFLCSAIGATATALMIKHNIQTDAPLYGKEFGDQAWTGLFLGVTLAFRNVARRWRHPDEGKQKPTKQ